MVRQICFMQDMMIILEEITRLLILFSKSTRKNIPDDVYGWFMGAHAVEAMDTAETGMAKPLYEKVIAIGDTTQDKDSI